MKSKTAIYIAIKIIAITTFIKGLTQGSHLPISLSQQVIPKTVLLPTITLLITSIIFWQGAGVISNTISDKYDEKLELPNIDIYNLYKIVLTIIGIFTILSALPDIIRSITAIELAKNHISSEMIYNQKISVYILFLELFLGFILVFKSSDLSKLMNKNSRS